MDVHPVTGIRSLASRHAFQPLEAYTPVGNTSSPPQRHKHRLALHMHVPMEVANLQYQLAVVGEVAHLLGTHKRMPTQSRNMPSPSPCRDLQYVAARHQHFVDW